VVWDSVSTAIQNCRPLGRAALGRIGGRDRRFRRFGDGWGLTGLYLDDGRDEFRISPLHPPVYYSYPVRGPLDTSICYPEYVTTPPIAEDSGPAEINNPFVPRPMARRLRQNLRATRRRRRQADAKRQADGDTTGDTTAQRRHDSTSGRSKTIVNPVARHGGSVADAQQ